MNHSQSRLEREAEGALSRDFEGLQEGFAFHHVELGGCLEQVVTGKLAQSLGASDEDRRLERLGEEEEEEDEGRARQPQELQERPAPVLRFCSKGSDDRCQSRCRDCADSWREGQESE